MQLNLNRCAWRLMGHWPYAPVFGRSMETGAEFQGVTQWIPARVPGCVQADLLRAGLIADPQFEKNSLLCEWVENRWWQYQCTFSLPENARAQRVTLEFKGVDYAAHFYLNGQKLGWHEGMFDSVIFDITALVRPENRIDVIVENAPAENGQLGHTSRTVTQKARFGYKWDFGTRLVHLGIWDEVNVNLTGAYRLADMYLHTDVDDGGRGIICLSGRVDGLCGRTDAKIRLLLRRGGAGLCELDVRPNPRDGRFEHRFLIDNPALWQVNGLGEQPLYEVSAQLEDGEGLSDSWEGRAGIRRIRYLRNDGAGEDSLPYTLEINGRRVYIRGVNMTPLSHMYGALTQDDYRRQLAQARAMGVNLIRVWGGGLIEKECFYRMCDEMGILVWQEFIQSSSGVDNIPSKRPHFLELLQTAARAAICARRNYTCLAVWSGGNELMDARGVPADAGDENIAMLQRLCAELDPARLFLPTSASGPNSNLRLDQPGRNHDVHGNWQYEGIPAHYARYNRSDSLLQSEFGCQGLSSPEALAKIFSPERIRPVSMGEDLVWRHHGEWWDSYERDSALFGPLEDIGQWSVLSQFIQGEAIRYIVESNRRRKYRNSGSIIWQLNEPWYNANCTSLLEHDGTPKLAVYAVKKAFAAVSLSAQYDSLICPAGEKLSLKVFVHNALDQAVYTACARVMDVRGRCLEQLSQRVCAAPNAATEAFEFCPAPPAAELGLLIVELSLLDGDRRVFVNRLLFSQAGREPFAALKVLPRTSLRASLKGDVLRIENTGDTAAMFAHAVSRDRARPLVMDDNYEIILPGCFAQSSVRTPCGGPPPNMFVRALNADTVDI